MRTMTLIALTVLVPAGPLAADDESDKANAQRLFQQMEAKLGKAKTLTLSFDGRFESDSPPFKGWKLKGTVAVMGKKSRGTQRGQTWWESIQGHDDLGWRSNS